MEKFLEILGTVLENALKIFARLFVIVIIAWLLGSGWDKFEEPTRTLVPIIVFSVCVILFLCWLVPMFYGDHIIKRLDKIEKILTEMKKENIVYNENRDVSIKNED